MTSTRSTRIRERGYPTNAEDKEAAVKLAVKKIDQAAARVIIHKNSAAHKKSQFTIKLNNLVYDRKKQTENPLSAF